MPFAAVAPGELTGPCVASRLVSSALFYHTGSEGGLGAGLGCGSLAGGASMESTVGSGHLQVTPSVVPVLDQGQRPSTF